MFNNYPNPTPTPKARKRLQRHTHPEFLESSLRIKSHKYIYIYYDHPRTPQYVRAFGTCSVVQGRWKSPHGLLPEVKKIDNNRTCASEMSKIPNNQSAMAFMQPLCISKDKALDQPPADQVWEMNMSWDHSNVFAGLLARSAVSQKISEISPNKLDDRVSKEIKGKPTLIVDYYVLVVHQVNVPGLPLVDIQLS